MNVALKQLKGNTYQTVASLSNLNESKKVLAVKNVNMISWLISNCICIVINNNSNSK